MKQQKADRTPAQRKAQRRWGTNGAVAASGSPLRTIPVTMTLIIVTVAIWVLQMIPGIGTNVTGWLAFQGWRIDPEIPELFQPWRALTVSLVHSTGSFLHVALNMLSLWMVGRVLEPMLGRWRFIALYAISSIAGSVVTALVSPDVVVVGASGAIFGAFAALIVIVRKLGGSVTSMMVVIGINFVYGLVVNGIAWQAHLGGLIGGALTALVFVYTRPADRQKYQPWMLAGIVVLFAAATFLIPVLHPVY